MGRLVFALRHSHNKYAGLIMIPYLAVVDEVLEEN
jgi:hypothetical protein